MSIRTKVTSIALLAMLAAISADSRVSGGAVFAEDDADPDSQLERKPRASAAHLAVMKRQAESLTIVTRTDTGTAPVDLIEPALLRYSNPAGQIVVPDASVWAWGRTGRPVVLASIDNRGCEMVSLTDQTVSLTTRSGENWSSTCSKIEWHAIAGAPPPGDSSVARALQMKQFARRFTATGHYGNGEDNYKLRLLERPLYRYANQDEGVVDGAVYTFAAGTNPEVILLLECRTMEDHRLAWHFGCTRMSAGRLEAHLDEKTVWTCPAIVRWSDTAPYSKVPWGPEDASVGSDSAE